MVSIGNLPKGVTLATLETYMGSVEAPRAQMLTASDPPLKEDLDVTEPWEAVSTINTPDSEFEGGPGNLEEAPY